MRDKKRVVIIAIGTFFLLSLLVAQYFSIQILEGEKWTKTALAQHECVVKEPFRRGTFFSNGSLKEGHSEKPQPLVFDVTKFHLYIDPVAIPPAFQEEIASQISLFTHLDKEMIKGELKRKSRSRKLATWIEKECKERVLKWWKPYAKKRKIERNALFFSHRLPALLSFWKVIGSSAPHHSRYERGDDPRRTPYRGA